MEDDSTLNIVDHGDIACRCGRILDVFHVPSLSTNLFLVSQLTQTGKIVEFCPDLFFIKNLKDRLIIAGRPLDPKD